MGMFLRRGPAPKLGTPLADIAEGKLIKLNESGSPVEFYVAKHDYEPELNGNGRTLIVRKDCYDIRAFSSNNNAFSGSSMDTWLNGTYKGLLDADVQDAMGLTAFYYTPGNGNNTVTTLQRAVFLLSLTELGLSYVRANEEGTALDISATLKIANLNGIATKQWTRTPDTSYKKYVLAVTARGTTNYNVHCTASLGSRPTFTLPSDFLVTNDILIT